MAQRPAAALAPAVASVVALTVDTGTAHAASVGDQTDFTFINFAGQRVTCTIFSEQEFPYDRNDDEASASTVVEGAPSCEENSVRVHVTYLLPDGRPATGGARGDGEVFGFWEPVGSDFRSEHSVLFFDCDSGSDSDGSFDTTLVQPK